jgi:hypothetical protein
MRKSAAIIGVSVLLCASALAQADQPNSVTRTEAAAAAQWETPVRAFPTQCTDLPERSVSPVDIQHRSDAIVQLANAQAVEITDAEASELTGSAFSGATGVRPFLVRAVAKNETPAFSVRLCGDVLYVMHGSLGRGPPPPSHRVPLVVLLEHEPARVVVTWAIAA